MTNIGCLYPTGSVIIDHGQEKLPTLNVNKKICVEKFNMALICPELNHMNSEEFDGNSVMSPREIHFCDF